MISSIAVPAEPNSGENTHQPLASHTAPRSGSGNNKLTPGSRMAIYKGLRIEILEEPDAGVVAPYEPCEEFYDTDCHNQTTGLTSYQYVCLRPGRAFHIKVKIEDNFDWVGSNGLSLQIDFDNRTTVNNAAVYVSRFSNADLNPVVQLTRRDVDRSRSATITRITQLIEPNLEEEVSFKTRLLRAEVGKPTTTTRRHGELTIAVHRCTLDESRAQERLLRESVPTARPTAKSLEEAGIYSKIV